MAAISTRVGKSRDELDEVATALRARDVLPLTVRARSDRRPGAALLSLDEAADAVPDVHRRLAVRIGDRRAAAFAAADWVARTPALVVGLPALLRGVVPILQADRILVRRHDDDWFDAYTIEPAWVVGSPTIGRVSRTISCAAIVSAWWQGMLDVMAAKAPLRRRARLFPVAWSGGTTCFQVRGTCCLLYRSSAAPDRDGDGYCATCPLRTDRSRTERLRASLDVR